MEILRKIYYSNMFRYIVTPTIGFGVAGALWGLDIYRGATGSNEAFINPFSFISGAFLFGILGSLSLVIFSGDLKKILKVVGVGTIGWLVAFLVPAVISYYLFLASAIIGTVNVLILPRVDLISFLSLPFSVLVGDLWLEFFLTGLIAGLVYGVLFRRKFLRASIMTGFGFSLGSFAGPSIGNLINTLMGHPFVLYLVAFSLIGGVLGFTLGRILKEKTRP